MCCLNYIHSSFFTEIYRIEAPSVRRVLFIIETAAYTTATPIKGICHLAWSVWHILIKKWKATAAWLEKLRWRPNQYIELLIFIVKLRVWCSTTDYILIDVQSKHFVLTVVVSNPMQCKLCIKVIILFFMQKE